ncbi:hypothetical protein ADEAN_000438300 [Angomonas deanei]|uniref:Uncharacterized protein n=1 Tax=Angomonas deanei TaxID=59799 RepID=A0A7G2CBS0_9TRYP|nr:hypothetical protein ADEAN_000438300 [Angomonas deanei]
MKSTAVLCFILLICCVQRVAAAEATGENDDVARYVLNLQRQIVRGPSQNTGEDFLNPKHIPVHSACRFYGLQCPPAYVEYLEKLAAPNNNSTDANGNLSERRNTTGKRNSTIHTNSAERNMSGCVLIMKKEVDAIRDNNTINQNVIYGREWIQNCFRENQDLYLHDYTSVMRVNKKLTQLRIKEGELQPEWQTGGGKVRDSVLVYFPLPVVHREGVLFSSRDAMCDDAAVDS